MARTQRDLEGWELIFHDDDTSHTDDQPRRRSRRSAPLVQTITLKRHHLPTEVNVGDFIKLSSDEVVLVSEIRLGGSDYLEVNTFSTIPQPEGKFMLTPVQGKLEQVLSIVQVVDSVPTHAYDPDEEHQVELDWQLAKAMLIANKIRFSDWLKEAVLPPESRRPSAEPLTPRKRQKRSRYVELLDEEVNEDLGDDYVADVQVKLEPSDDELPDMDDEAEDDIDAEILDGGDDGIANPFNQPSTPKRKPGRPRVKPLEKDDENLKFMKDVLNSTTKKSRIRNLPQKSVKNKVDLSQLSPSKKKLLGLTINKTLDKTSQAFKDLKAKLEAGSVFEMVVGREDEFMTIMMNVQDAIWAEEGCCIYVSGTPGTGKTATIRHVVEALKQEMEAGQVPPFDFTEICGLRIILAPYVYELLWESISGYKIHPSNASTLLDEHFKQGRAKRPMVVFLDELDLMVLNRQEVLYNLLNWPTYTGSKLIVIASANTMDLPERMLANKVSLRLGLRRIQFPGYTHTQLQDIFKHRLELLAKEMSTDGARVIVQPQGLEFAARKAASIVGDARRALGVARRAVELCYEELQQKKQGTSLNEHPLTIAHITRALADYDLALSPQPYLTSLPYASKLVMALMLACMKRLGKGETTMGQVVEEMRNSVLILAHPLHEFKEIALSLNWQELLFGANSFYFGTEFSLDVRVRQFNYIVSELAESGVVVMENRGGELYRKIKFNFPKDEIEAAVKDLTM